MAESTKRKTKVKKPAPKKQVKKPTTYVAVKVKLFHPFQKVYIPVEPPGVQLTKDSWLETQLERGLVRVF